MDYTTLLPIVLSILTSVITGGFVLVFIELGNRKQRENDRYHHLMSPFCSKFSAYLRFLNWSRSRIVYPQELNDYEKNFQTIIERISKYGSKLIIMGGDYSEDHFSINKLNEICEDINNVWYWHDKMHPCRITCSSSLEDLEYIIKDLNKIDSSYSTNSLNIDLIAKISGEFYTEVYQLVEGSILRHHSYTLIYNKQTRFVAISGILVLLSLCLLLFLHPPILLMQLTCLIVVLLFVLSIFLLGTDMKTHIRVYNKYSALKETIKKNLSYFRWRRQK